MDLYKELQTELYRFLLQHDISVETPIFNDVLKKLLNINPSNKSRGSFGFSLYQNSEGDFLSFNFPELSIPDYMKMLDFFEIPEEDRVIGSEIKVSKTTIFDKLLPLFKEYVTTKMPQDERTAYVIGSRQALEASAIDSMKSALNTLILNINTIENYATIDDASKELSRKLFSIRGVLQDLREHVFLYRYLTDAVSDLNLFFANHPAMRHQANIKPKLDLLYSSLALYQKYNRAESAIAASKLKNEVATCMEQYNISTDCTDVFEETLLSMAGITNKPISCRYKIGDDRSRFVFTFEGITSSDAKMLVNYFKARGDLTAKEGYGYRAYNNFVNESTTEMALMSVESVRSMNEMSSSRRQIRREQHSIEVDAGVLFSSVFSLFKAQIAEWSKSSDRLLEYKYISFLNKVQVELVELSRLANDNKTFKDELDELVETVDSLLLSKSWSPDAIQEIRVAFEKLTQAIKPTNNAALSQSMDVLFNNNNNNNNNTMMIDAPSKKAKF